MPIDSAHRTIAAPEPPAGPIARAVDVTRQFLCGLHGHDALLHFEEGRISLQCSSCGYQSPGWDVRSTPSRTETIDTPRRVVRLPLVGQRRVA
jgi:hypothetical protein